MQFTKIFFLHSFHLCNTKLSNKKTQWLLNLTEQQKGTFKKIHFECTNKHNRTSIDFARFCFLSILICILFIFVYEIEKKKKISFVGALSACNTNIQCICYICLSWGFHQSTSRVTQEIHMKNDEITRYTKCL